MWILKLLATGLLFGAGMLVSVVILVVILWGWGAGWEGLARLLPGGTAVATKSTETPPAAGLRGQIQEAIRQARHPLVLRGGAPGWGLWHLQVVSSRAPLPMPAHPFSYHATAAECETARAEMLSLWQNLVVRLANAPISRQPGLTMSDSGYTETLPRALGAGREKRHVALCAVIGDAAS